MADIIPARVRDAAEWVELCRMLDIGERDGYLALLASGRSMSEGAWAFCWRVKLELVL